ncbi:MAG: hypothetical protein U5K70_09295 [Halodesulfurarchaeum sp.]|nr:hypothetical protein [Halodesulfurarchaeum sp.]
MGRSRGQMLLVAAFAMAVVFVALALILNTAIFTENLATRETTDGHDAVDFHDSVVETGDVILRETNAEESSYGTLVSTYRDRIDTYSDAELAHGLNRGTLRNVTLMRTHNGTLLNQSDGTNFENDGGNSTWQVAEGITDTRAGTLNVTAVDTNATFVFNVTDGSESWELAVNQSDETTFDVFLETPHNETSSRSYSTRSLEIQPTNGSIENETWADLQFQNGFSGAYDLWIGNGTNATGTFRMVVNKAEGEIDGSDYG